MENLMANRKQDPNFDPQGSSPATYRKKSNLAHDAGIRMVLRTDATISPAAAISMRSRRGWMPRGPMWGVGE